MRNWMWALLLLIPAVELFGFIWVSEQIGAGYTLLLILVTSIIGMAMMQFEGRKVLQDTRNEMQNGLVPGRKMLDGLCVFLGGSLLIIPGFVTDIIGFTLVFPLTRPIYRLFLLKWIEKKMKDGKITFYKRF
ncbi:FxsA family protein [Paenibacillus urinalis]|uniref:FxsA family protein n=1 Tax=Paenibacillus urinalis TaxID=521520 RepID=A0ABY7XDQ9_9BACL|nr:MULTISPECIES: FxsA family protein [Paenibacillus]WDH95708.1 FxsA family protein [Paenibacillus urinalis]WDI03905.1 FxsA family protein [Paenibacillus urinalis]GAK38749.1 FxsA cytoplasmic membrane protein [Paenibacillus sp. TCA20]